MSQAEQILAWLKAGHSLTPLEAYAKFDCLRLGGRIYDLRKTPEGRDIQTEDLHLPNGKIVARYSLPLPKGQLEFSIFQTKGPVERATRACP
jgi:hypothetical protein